MSWKDEFDRRLRVVVNAPEDAESLRVSQDYRVEGYCETCEYTTTYVEVTWFEAGGYRSVEFSDMGELIRQLDAVEDR